MSGTSSTVKHAAIYSAATMLGKLVGFIMLPFYAHKLGTAGYGVIGMVDASLSLLTGFMAYSFRGTIVRLYHEQVGENKRQVISTGIWITVAFVATMVLTAGVFSSPLSGLLFGTQDLAVILLLALGSFFFDTVGESAASTLIIERRSVIFSAVGLVRLIVGLSLNILLIVYLDYGVYGYFISAIICALLSAAIFGYYAISHSGLSYNKAIAKKIVVFHAPLIPGALVVFFSSQSERIILRFFESIEKVGILEMAYKFPSLISILVHTPFMRSWDTERVRLAEEGKDDAASVIGAMASLSLILTITISLIIAVGIDDILKILTPSEFWDASSIAQIGCLTAVLSSITYHVNFGYYYAKDTKNWALLTTYISLLKVAMSVGLIYRWGLWGAAYSGLIGQFLMVVFAARGGQRRFALVYNHRLNIVAILVGLSLFTVSEFFKVEIFSLSETIAAYLAPEGGHLPMTGERSNFDKIMAKLPYVIDFFVRASLCLPMLGILFYQYPSARKFVSSYAGRILTAVKIKRLPG